MSRCKACNHMLSNLELKIDDELCVTCLSSIREDLPERINKKLDIKQDDREFFTDKLFNDPKHT